MAAIAGASLWFVIGGLAGLAVGLCAAGVCWWFLGKLESSETKHRRARLLSDLPIAVDLLAACLESGASWPEAVEAVAEAVGGPLGEEFQSVAARVRLGADPAEAWLELETVPELSALARAAARASHSGAALAPALTRLSRDQRRTSRNAAHARAQAAGIKAVAPLGLCFLPAFVLLGIVPAIAGIARSITLP